MMRLVFCDLRDHAATWIGAFAVAVGCGFIGGWAASLMATADSYPDPVHWVMQSAGSMMLVFSLVAAAAVLVSAANLTVAAQRRSYALWQLANMKPKYVSRVVLAQLAVVAVLGAVCGTALAAVTFSPLFAWVFSAKALPAYVEPQVGVANMPAVWLAVAGVFLCGGLKGARAAARTSPMAALREPEPKRMGMTVVRVLLFAALAACTWSVVSIMLGSAPDVIVNYSMYVPVLVVATLAPVAPVLFSAVMRVWTLFVPERRASAWYLARRTARYGLAVSTSVETPIMVGVGLVAGLFSVVNVCELYAESQGNAFTGLDFSTSLILLGGPVLLCAIGAAVSVVMSSKTRTRDVALLTAAGASPETLVAAAVCEALIHAFTATAVGLAAAAASSALFAYALGLPLLDGVAVGEGLIVSLAGFVLLLAATLVPTLAALNREAAEVLAVRE